uniref:APC membrane recruitment protein 3 n=1 Tax=Pyxicephalus adspersus TaxID=30357 RepID=A0AAV3AFB3_PYXAD|nr:TPA: hypothetical protein GDO54_010264 [Pyxicephalus adspersus]
MERGKTFIISYAKNPSEKVPQVRCKDKKKIEGQKNPTQCDIKKNVTGTQRMSNNICTKVTVNNIRCPKPVTKSKTYDCVTKDDKLDKNNRVSGHRRLPSSRSSPGLIEDPGGKRNDLQATGPSTCKQTMIDYRHFVPQMPFVPSVAKSLPKKRISLRRSKKSLKNIFNLKRNKEQDTISEDESIQIVNIESNSVKMVEKQCQSNVGEMHSEELLAPEFPDREMYIDAIDSFKALCEDVASLKSFDSLTGCGEIFADECSSFIDIENCRVTFISRPSPVAANFQGGGERLASPAKSESIDFSRFHRHVKSLPRNLSSNELFEAKSLPDSNDADGKEIKRTLSKDQVSNLSYNDLMSSAENINEPESPKSTSDEGYYDSYSPRTEEVKNELETYRSFPRDSYSGDALYDFCVGSEENMATQPPNDLVEDGILQSTWKGGECLLKLCDTELTLTMGMVNWLKKTGRITDSEINDQNLTSDKTVEMETKIGNSTEALQTIASRDIRGECYKLHSGYKEKEYSSIISHIRDSENILADILSGNTTEKQATKLLESKEDEKGSTSEEHIDIKDSSLESQVPITLSKNDENQHVSSAENESMFPMASACEQDGTNVTPHHLDTLHSLGLQYTSNSMSENNKGLTNILDKFTARLSSLHITLGSQNIQHGANKIMRPYEITQNIKNLIEQHDTEHQTSLPQPALLSKSDNETDMKHLKTSDEPPLSNTLPIKYLKDEHTTNGQMPKEKQSSKSVTKTHFLPLFKSPCSSVISRFSSTLYKVHKPGDAIIFFNTGKYPQASSCNEDFANDLDGLSIDFSKFRNNEFEPISTDAEERGLL